jgi:hypothetical protein
LEAEKMIRLIKELETRKKKWNVRAL